MLSSGDTMKFPRMKDLRNDRDIHQSELAKYLGIAQNTYSAYESGRINIPSDMLVKIAQFHHVSLDYLVGQDIQRNQIKPIKPGKYRHFKGKEYRVLYNAQHSESLEPMVVYQALYGKQGVWVRPASMWNEHVERSGYSGPRFVYLGE